MTDENLIFQCRDMFNALTEIEKILTEATSTNKATLELALAVARETIAQVQTESN